MPRPIRTRPRRRKRGTRADRSRLGAQHVQLPRLEIEPLTTGWHIQSNLCQPDSTKDPRYDQASALVDLVTNELKDLTETRIAELVALAIRATDTERWYCLPEDDHLRWQIGAIAEGSGVWRIEIELAKQFDAQLDTHLALSRRYRVTER